MKTTLAAALLALAPISASAESFAALSFTGGLGGQAGQSYMGSDDYGAGIGTSFDFHYLRLGTLEFGDPDPNAQRSGLHARAAFRVLGQRKAADHPELAGLADVDTSVELGGGIGYQADHFLVFADLRYGVIGHQSLSGSLGADLVMRPTDRLTITAGPRAAWGSQDFNRTYFGVTPAEAAGSAFGAYAPGAGFVSVGLLVSASYALDDKWGIAGSLSWDRLIDEAAVSPIVQSTDAFGVSLMLTRRFTLGK